jgi:hypothetical protein
VPQVKTRGYESKSFQDKLKTDLKSQIFITARSLTCGKQHQKMQLPERQDKSKKKIPGHLFVRMIIV